MPTPLTRTLRAVLLAILIHIPLPALAETVAIPVSLTYPQLRFLVVREMFTGPDNTARYGLDDAGCPFVTYSEPHLSTDGQWLRVEVATLATIGVNTADGCATIGHWTGRTVVKGKPVLVDGQPLSAEFRLHAAELFDQQGHRLSGAPVLQASEERLHQALSTLRIDLSPEVDRLKEWLPSVLPRYSVDRLSDMVDSLRIGHILVRPDGIDVRLTIDVDKISQRGPEAKSCSSLWSITHGSFSEPCRCPKSRNPLCFAETLDPGIQQHPEGHGKIIANDVPSGAPHAYTARCHWIDRHSLGIILENSFANVFGGSATVSIFSV